jgi:hypothetical protein
MSSNRLVQVFLAFVASSALTACGPADADAVGVGAECSQSAPCPTYAVDGGTAPLACLPQFRGGYCGLQGCASSVECPVGSICVRHTDGMNYCFRTCASKPDCNRHRTPDNESNCSSSFTWAVSSEDNGAKACIPPSSG